MKYIIKDYPDIKKQVEKMDVDSLLRAVICPNISAGQPSPRGTASVFVHPTTAEKAYATAQDINNGRENPALIVSDMEFGAGTAITDAVCFPSMRAAAETGDKTLAYKMGEIAAKEAYNAGYHWTFGPCVDILSNRANPVVHLRTAGDDADTVIEYGGAYMDGLQDNGLIATLKHFPGDGYCTDDQHVTTPENPLSAEDWDETFGRVYKTLIDRGAMSIMPGHISLPAYDEADEFGIYPPATVSKNLLTGLLKEKLGFEGIIVSDAVDMNGFCGYMNYHHACAAFLEAGGDCLLFFKDTEENMTNLKKCVEEGRLTIETLKDRAYRMLCFAREYFERFPQNRKHEFDRDAAEKTAKEMTENAIKVIRDRYNLLPIEVNKETKILHLVIYNYWNRNFKVVEELTEKMSQIAGKVDELRDPGPERLVPLAKSGEYNLIVCSVLESPEYGLQSAKLCGNMSRNMMLGWMKYGTPVVFIGHNSVCFGDTYRPSTDTLVNAYGTTKYTADALMKTIFK